MSTADTYTVASPWSEAPDEKAFNRLVKRLMFVTFLLSLAIAFIRLPEESRQVQERIPVRLAQIIMEKKKPKPIPIVLPKPVELEPKEKKVETAPREMKPAPPKKETKPKFGLFGTIRKFFHRRGKGHQ